jgi:hypothetical protein
MTAGRAGEQPAPVVVRAELEPGVECLGEWIAAPGSLGSAILLHDLGSDLDSMRHVSRALVSAGVGVLSLDLPGHGISAGDYWTHGSAAVEAAAEYVAGRGGGEVAVVAHGHSCAIATGAAVAPVAAVLVDPRSGQDAPARQESWNTVSTVFIQDPLDEVMTAEVDRTMAQMHAWTVRVDLHPDRETAGDAEALPRLAMPQVTGMTAKFLLEQFAYAAARSGRWSPPGAGGGGDVGQPGQ